MNLESRMRFRPSPALVVASIALAVSLGGTGYAAFKLPVNSVGTAQLKKNAVTSLKVKNGSLLKVDFKQDQLPAGAQGPPGQQGAKGDKGDKGDTGSPGVSSLEWVQGATNNDSNPAKAAFASCPAGKKVIGGGAWATNSIGGGSPALIRSVPTADLTQWAAFAAKTSASWTGNWQLISVAICATVAS